MAEGTVMKLKQDLASANRERLELLVSRVVSVRAVSLCVVGPHRVCALIVLACQCNI